MHVDPPPPANSHPPAPEPSGWTRQQDKLLELLLLRMEYPQWDRIAVHLGDKTPDEARRRYESVAAELRRVLEAPRVETPPEWDLQQPAGHALTVGHGERTGGKEDAGAPADGEAASAGAGAGVGEGTGAPARSAGGDMLGVGGTRKRGRKAKDSAQEKNRAVPWTPDEHRLFLAGIKEHGVGKWQKLAREFVPTRNASQIASHYQKYSIRQQKLRRNECKRPSIHDINDDDTLSPAGKQSAAAVGEAGGGC
ncbi:transcription factor MYBS1-like [Triticum aestivum]|uniref:transcription factor MYBS1-like n=1 Tax=Triticum aestivum TaxID=4565 RepID=UPI0008455211|nr:transcription factor MYBS1-like [Triticum aestivum]